MVEGSPVALEVEKDSSRYRYHIKVLRNERLRARPFTGPKKPRK